MELSLHLSHLAFSMCHKEPSVARLRLKASFVPLFLIKRLSLIAEILISGKLARNEVLLWNYLAAGGRMERKSHPEYGLI